MIEVVLIIILGISAYWSILYHHYVSDDLMVYSQTNDKKIKKPRTLGEYLLKQLLGDSYWDSHKRMGRRRQVKLKLSRFWVRLYVKMFPHGREERNVIAHGMSIILHTTCAVLVYLAFKEYSQPAAWLGALYFLVSPAQHEGSLWLSGKPYVWTACILLLVFLNPLAVFLMPWMMWFLTVTAVPFPAVFLGTMYWPFAFMLWFVYKAKKPNISKGRLYEEATEPMTFHWGKLILATKFYGYNIFNALTVMHCTLYQSYSAGVFTNSRGAKHRYHVDRYFFFGLFVVGLMAYGLIRQEPWGFGLFWYSVLIAPFCNLISIGQQLATSRYAYLANAGLYFSLACFVLPYPLVAGGLFCWYARQLLIIKQSYRNDYWNTAFATFDEPTYVQTWIHYGAMHYSRHEFHAALKAFREGIDCDPENFHCWFNMSSCYVCMNMIPDSIKALNKAESCELLFQKQTKENIVTERKKLIGLIYHEQKQGKEVELKVSDVPILV